MSRKIILGALLIILVLSLTGCMPGNQRYDQQPAGFFWEFGMAG